MRGNIFHKQWLRDTVWVVVVGLGLTVALEWGRRVFDRAPRQQWSINMPVSVPGLTFSSQPRTLLLVTSSECQYCRASSRFHAALVSQAHAAGIPVVVLVGRKTTRPTGLESVATYVDKTVQVDMADLGIPGTPTIALVSRDSRLSGLWIGKLSSTQEQSLLERLGEKAHTVLDRDGKASSLRRVRNEEITLALRDSIVVDVRTRDEYSSSHRAEAINIPLDELALRGFIELPHSSLITLDCNGLEWSRCDLAERVLADLPTHLRVRALDKGAMGASCLRSAVR